ncbi:MAG: T9SS type A sorting domain-containing protein [Ignavibacteriaceae bacterium]|nr:T9SS type A sorting domain-containing protein [Ignavibacteriaceae bacterium]
MKSLSLVLLFSLVLISDTSFSQVFHINNNPAEGFVIDKVGKDIYYWEFSSGVIKKNLYTSQIDTVDFGYSFPSFANKTHKNVLFETQYIARLYNLDKDTSYIIFNLDNKKKLQKSICRGLEYASFIFSPNDSLILFHDPDSYYWLKAFRFSDSTFYICPAQTLDYARIEWSSDSTLIFKSHDTEILECYLYSGRIDTLVKIENKYILGYSYNRQQNILAYSYGNDYPHNKIYIYYRNGDSTRVIFDLAENPSGVCTGNVFTYLKWDDEGENLAVITDLVINHGSGIMRYSLNADEIHYYVMCDDYRLKHFVQWWNTDTVIYVNDMSIDGLYLDKPIGVKEDSEIKTDENIQTGVYPNPFNPNLTIRYNLPAAEEVKISIYDVMGRQINVLTDELKTAGLHELNFTADAGLASGIYFVSIITNSFTKTQKIVLIK